MSSRNAHRNAYAHVMGKKYKKSKHVMMMYKAYIRFRVGGEMVTYSTASQFHSSSVASSLASPALFPSIRGDIYSELLYYATNLTTRT